MIKYSILQFIIVITLILPISGYAVQLVGEEEITNSKAVQEISSPPTSTEKNDTSEIKIPTEETEAVKNKSQSVKSNDIAKEEKASSNKPKNMQSKDIQEPPSDSKDSHWSIILYLASFIIILFFIKRLLVIKIESNKRKIHLIETYGEDVGLRIFNEEIWIGMTVDQLLASWGSPDDIKEGAYQETYYYKKIEGPRGGVSYKHKITIKNDEVYKII